MRKIPATGHTADTGSAKVGWLLGLAAILLASTITALEFWASTPAWLTPVRNSIVSVFHWVKVNWLSAAALSATAAIMSVVVPFIIRALDRHPVRTAGRALQDQQRTIMLQRVRYKWISGVLEPSLAQAARLVLGLERRPELLDLSRRRVRRPGQPSEMLPAGVSIGDVFDRVGGGLLIVGTPGSGKTTALLQLCDELLHRAEADSSQAIPVVFNLASWARDRATLGAWLVDELSRAYQVPRHIAAEWIRNDALALLLDGLDEVAGAHRTACADAINAWRKEHGLVPLVICGRTAELQTLGTELLLDEAVELQPPQEADVDRYLSYLEATGTPLADVRMALVSDRELQDLLRSPLCFT